MRRIYHVLFLGLLFIFPLSLLAQNKMLTGKVTDVRDNTPLPGVTVKVKGANLGTVTKADGTYQLSVPAGAGTLIFSFIGYRELEVPIGASGTVDAVLTAGNKELSEVVVIGYGTQVRKDVTGSVAKVSAKDFENQPMPTFETALQGRTTGIYMNSGSGKLGQAPYVRIRGISSVNAGQSPLYVVDGVPIVSGSLGSADAEPDNPLATIDPNEIESIDVLKDASTAAIYGARGANGVILVTTKRGKIGKTRISLNASYGTSKAAHLQKFLNAAQYRELFTEAATNAGANIKDEFNGNTGTTDWDKNYDTKWSEAGFQQGFYNEYSLGISGGDNKTRFYLSGVYNKQKGIIVGNDQQRIGGRVNLEHSITDRIRTGVNLNLMRTFTNRVPNDNAFDNPVQLNALPPLQPLYDAQGRYNAATIYYNNLINLESGVNTGLNYTGLGNVYFAFDLLPGLTFKTDYGFNFVSFEEEQFSGLRTQTGGSVHGSGYNNSVKSMNQIFSNTFTYTKKFAEKHDITALLGMIYDDNKLRNNDVTGQNFPNDKFQKIANAAKITGGTSFETANANVSYIVRANYKFMDKYLLQANMNVNGSSRFGTFNKKYKYGVFPGVQAGWILSEENFLKNSEAINFLKLRVGYGLTGNDRIGNFDSRSLYGSVSYAEAVGLVPVRLAVPDLRWEKLREINVGLDFGFLKDRINGSVDVFSRKTLDMLLDVQVPASNGYTTIRKNLGSMQNKGVEVGINSKNFVGEFKWNTNLTLTFYKNKVLDMQGTSINPGTRTLGRIAEGEPYGYFYGVKFAGADPQNGDALYYDASGKTTNKYSQAAEQKLGSPHPDYYGGFGNTFSYKGFSLDVQTQFVVGNKVFNQAGMFQSVNADYFDNQTIDQLNRWRKAGDITRVPQARLYDGNGTAKSDRWMQDGSFLRFKSVNLSYNLPRKWTRDMRMESLRVYVAASNLFTITNYTGYDPEVNTSYLSSQQLGHDFYTPPQARTITFGLNVNF